MTEERTTDWIDHFLGSAHVFASAVSDVIEEELLQLVDRQITVSQLKLLMLVSMSDAQRIGDVASFLGVSNPAASKAVDRLVRMMLLRRSEGETDRRSIRLSLTRPGQRILDAYEALRRQKIQQVFCKFKREELQRAAILLDRLSAQIIYEDAAEGEQMCLQCQRYLSEKCVMRKLLSRRCPYQEHRTTASGKRY